MKRQTKFSKYKVLICGYYGFNNIGDDAVLDALSFQILTLLPGAKIGVLVGKKKNLPSVYKKRNIECINRKNPFSLFRAFFLAETFVLGGGSLVQNKSSRRSLFYYTLMLFFGRIFCKKVIIFANGIGPLTKNSGKLALRLAHRISVRDPISYETALSLGVDKRKLFLCADPVFLMRKERVNTNIPILQKPFFAVSLRGTDNVFGKPLENIIEFCKNYQSMGYTPIFIPMQEKFDGEICRMAASCCNGEVFETNDPQKVYAIIEKAEFAVGMRLHFLLMAVRAGVPLVPLSYDIKIDGCLPYAGEDNVIPVEGVTFEKIEKALADSYARDTFSKRKYLSEQKKVAREEIYKLVYDISFAENEAEEKSPLKTPLP